MGADTRSNGAVEVRPLAVVLGELLDGDDAPQVRTIFGERPAVEIAEAVAALVRRRRGAEVVGCSYAHVSVGVVLQLRQDDACRCMLKACRADGAAEARNESLRVQAHLALAGFPAPAVLSPFEPCAGAHVHLAEVIDRGEPSRWDVSTRDLMAREYARLVTLAESLSPRPALADGGPPAERLWPTPHSVIFDFEATTAGAGPIDAIASDARARLRARAGARVVAHCDWALQNVALRDGRLVGVFDWDSVRLVSEPSAVAGAAVFHMQDWRVGPDSADHDFYPGPEDAMAFARAYADARGRPWSRDERDELRAAMLYRLGYQARCQHALGGGPAVGRLLRFAEAFGRSESP